MDAKTIIAKLDNAVFVGKDKSGTPKYVALRSTLGSTFKQEAWVCILGAAPFALMGFVKYNGMNAEQFVWAWIKSEFLMPKKLMFHPDNLYYETLKTAIQNHEKEALKNNA